MKSNKKSTSRRRFLQQSSLAAGIMIVPRHVLGGKGFIAPSDKLNIAAIGAGGKGMVDLMGAYNNGTDNIAVLCDVDDRQAQKARDKFPKAAYYKDFRIMLEKENKNIDAVIVATPDHMHGMIALAAMELGKHVYVEKPLTHDIYEARMLTEAAKKYKVVTQMGNQGSSGDDTRKVETWIQKGIIGDVHTVKTWTNRPVWPQGIPLPTEKQTVPEGVDWDLWLGTAPQRDYNEAFMPFRWRGWWDYGTGALGDMGCHIMDVPFRALELGYPTSVSCSVGSVFQDYFEEAFFPESCPPSSAVHLKFAGKGDQPLHFSWYDGGIIPERPEELGPNDALGSVDGGIIMEGSKGKLIAEKWGTNPIVFVNGARMNEADLPKSEKPFVEGGPEMHQHQWAKACKEGYGAYTSSPFEMAGPLTETVIMGNLAVRSYNYREEKADGQGFVFPGRKELLWDGPNMKITNFDQANEYVKRDYRTGW